MKQNCKILIVDDEQQTLDTYKQILTPPEKQTKDLLKMLNIADEDSDNSPPNFDLSLATQGEQAYELVKQSIKEGDHFALSFMDMRMPPGWDGLTTASKIRELDDEIFIIIATGYSDRTIDEIQAILQHDVLLINKPFNHDDIYQFAKNFCQHWSLSHL